MNTIVIPTMTPFTIPKDATIESLKEGLPMSAYCRSNLTTANFGIGVPPCRKLLGGFLTMPGNFSSEAGVSAVEELARQTDKKIRLGTPCESLAYKKANTPHPKWWVVLSKVFSGYVLRWGGWSAGASEFDLRFWDGVWGSRAGVFVVEEPEG